MCVGRGDSAAVGQDSSRRPDKLIKDNPKIRTRSVPTHLHQTQEGKKATVEGYQSVGQVNWLLRVQGDDLPKQAESQYPIFAHSICLSTLHGTTQERTCLLEAQLLFLWICFFVLRASPALPITGTHVAPLDASVRLAYAACLTVAVVACWVLHSLKAGDMKP